MSTTLGSIKAGDLLSHRGFVQRVREVVCQPLLGLPWVEVVLEPPVEGWGYALALTGPPGMPVQLFEGEFVTTDSQE